MFLKTRDGDQINITEIIGIKEHAGETVAQLRTGEAVKLPWGVDPNIAARAACQVLPAQPGFEFLMAYLGDHPDEPVTVEHQPVIGWRIEPSGPDPIVLHEDWCCDDKYRTAIRTPDGQIIAYNEGMMENEAAWRAHVEWLMKDAQKEKRKPVVSSK